MFGSIGGPELIVIFIIALLIFGPRKLPEIGKAIGKGLAEFKRATTEFKRSLESEVEEEAKSIKEVKGEIKEAGSDLKDTVRQAVKEYDLKIDEYSKIDESEETGGKSEKGGTGESGLAG